MQKNHFLLLKKFKNTESAQLWSDSAQILEGRGGGGQGEKGG